MRSAVVALVAIVLAGCMAPDGERDTDRTLGPQSIEVDMRRSVLNITLLEGKPTVVVTLSITEDLWIHPHYGAGLVEPFAAEDASRWVLCPWTRAYGLPPDVQHRVIPMWEEEGKLTAAMTGSGWGVPAGDGCDALHESPVRYGSIEAAQPHDGTLVLLVTAAPLLSSNEGSYRDPRSAHPSTAPSFQLIVGVATQRCTDDVANADLCPPAHEVDVEPTYRAGDPEFSRYYGEGDPCDDCGFDVVDSRTLAEVAAEAGKLTFTARHRVGQGITLALGGSGAGQDVRGAPIQTAGTGRIVMDALLAADRPLAEVHCEENTNQASVAILAEHSSAPRLDIAFDVVSSGRRYALSMLTVPIDLGAMGWALETGAWTQTLPSLLTGTSGPGCDDV